MFSSEFCGIFKKIFSYKTSPVAASEPSAPTTIGIIWNWWSAYIIFMLHIKNP